MDWDGPKVGSTDFGSWWHVRGGKASNRGCPPGFPLEAVALDSSSHVFTVSTYLMVLPHVCLFLLIGVWAGVGEHFEEGPLLFLVNQKTFLVTSSLSAAGRTWPLTDPRDAGGTGSGQQSIAHSGFFMGRMWYILIADGFPQLAVNV